MSGYSSSGDHEGGFDIEKTWDIAPAVRHDLTVNVWVDAFDYDDVSANDRLGTVSVDYSVDNLWGLSG